MRIEEGPCICKVLEKSRPVSENLSNRRCLRAVGTQWRDTGGESGKLHQESRKAGWLGWSKWTDTQRYANGLKEKPNWLLSD